MQYVVDDKIKLWQIWWKTCMLLRQFCIQERSKDCERRQQLVLELHRRLNCDLILESEQKNLKKKKVNIMAKKSCQLWTQEQIQINREDCGLGGGCNANFKELELVERKAKVLMHQVSVDGSKLCSHFKRSREVKDLVFKIFTNKM